MEHDESPLRRWRLSVGMTQQRLAELAGVSQGHISQVEQGYTNIKGNLKTYLENVAGLCKEQCDYVASMKKARKGAQDE